MTRPPLQHGDTEARAVGFDAALESVFEKVRANARALGLLLGVGLLAGVITALAWESAQRAEAAAATELARIEAEFAAAMGAPPGAALPPEPANPDLGRRAREAAVGQLESLIDEHGGTQAAQVARVRAAEMEADLGRLGAASERLTGIESRLADDDPLLGVALRLHGYVLDELGRGLEAAETYERGAEVPTYGARALLFIEAGRAYERVSEPGRALAAYQRAVSLAPDLADRMGLPRRIATLDYLATAPGAAAAAPASPDVSSDKEHSVMQNAPLDPSP